MVAIQPVPCRQLMQVQRFHPLLHTFTSDVKVQLSKEILCAVYLVLTV